MTVSFIRVLFVLLSCVVGYQVGSLYHAEWGLYGAMIGPVAAVVVILTEWSLARVSLRGLSAAVFGLMLALLVSKLLTSAVDLVPMPAPVAASVKLVLVLLMSYLGMIFSLRGRDEFNVVIPYIKFQQHKMSDEPVLLDTSALIDGRFIDIYRASFLDGRLVVPKFVLKELQTMSDSSDAEKRKRGRRGLEILNQVQNDNQIPIRVHDDDFSELSDTDAKIVKLARMLGARIVTGDYALGRLAEAQKVRALNIHELARSLRNTAMPMDHFRLVLVKEGKDKDQAVGFLADGTLVVVENAKAMIGQEVSVTVNSILPTQQGKIVFARLDASTDSVRSS